MQSFEFSVSIIRFWLRGHIKVDQSMVEFKVPNALFGLIPLGAYQERAPLKNLSSVQRDFRVRGFQLILGLLLAVFNFLSIEWLGFFLGTELLGNLRSVFFALFGLLLVADSFQHTVVIEKSGSVVGVVLPFFDGAKARQIHDTLSSGLYSDADKTDLGRYFEPLPGPHQQTAWHPQQPGHPTHPQPYPAPPSQQHGQPAAWQPPQNRRRPNDPPTQPLA